MTIFIDYHDYYDQILTVFFSFFFKNGVSLGNRRESRITCRESRLTCPESKNR